MVREYYLTRVPPFGHPRINACLRLPEALSLFATSFFGSWCLGILRVLFIAYPAITCTTEVAPDFDSAFVALFRLSSFQGTKFVSLPFDRQEAYLSTSAAADQRSTFGKRANLERLLRLSKLNIEVSASVTAVVLL